MKFILSELSNFSFRKLAALTCILIFAIACIGFLIINGFKELPASYVLVISTIMISYFAKKPISEITAKFSKNEETITTAKVREALLKAVDEVNIKQKAPE